MGKKSKPFIKKGEGQHFHLVYRSQRDEANITDENASEFVLVPSNNKKQQKQHDEVQGVSWDSIPRKDHVNELGFKNDGYDYSQHIKVIEGGKYMGKDGKIVERIAPVLPKDALASEGEFQRDYEAITISEELMDEDIRAALFEDNDEEGEFEALDDDFVMQVMQEPEKPDFDFDAHIARLIEMSEKMIGDDQSAVPARGWDDPNLKGHFLKRKVKTRTRIGGSRLLGIYDDDEFDDEEFDDGVSDGDNDDEGDEYEVEEEYEDADEEEFEKVLGEYDDSKLGYISDEDDNIATKGVLDPSRKGNALLEAALNEFLSEQKDHDKYNGLSEAEIEKMKRNFENFRSGISDNDEVDPKKIDYKREYEEQLKSQEESAALFPEFVGDIRRALTEFHEGKTEEEQEAIIDQVMSSQQYLKENRVREQWDCETVLSTYSTLDNHPTLIKDSNSKFRPYKSRFEKQAENNANRSDGRSTVASLSLASIKPFPGKAATFHSLQQQQQQQPKAQLKEEKGNGGQVVEGVEEEENDEDEEDEIEEEEKVDDLANFRDKHGTLVRKKDETKEEKKLRKQAIKEERKQKRTVKKDLKMAYKEESIKLNKVTSIANTSIFRY